MVPKSVWAASSHPAQDRIKNSGGIASEWAGVIAGTSHWSTRYATVCQGQRMDFGVSTQDVDGIMIVTVTGEVDVHTAPSLDAEAVAASRPGERLIIDAGQVGFIDSTAVGVLIKAHQTALRSGGRLDVVVADDRVRRVLEITGLDAVLNIHPTLEAALLAG